MIFDVGDFGLATWLIIATTFIWFFIDIYLYVTKRETLSQAMRKAGEFTLAFVFACGFLMGHWFW